MPTRPQHQSSSSSRTPSRQLAEVLERSIGNALSEQCAERYKADIAVHELEVSTGDCLDLRIQVRCRGLTRMPVRLTVTHAGGNIYDVLCRVEDGNSHRFSHSLPGRTGTRLSHAPYLGRELATFLREELEKRLGRLLLQSPARPPRERPSILP